MVKFRNVRVKMKGGKSRIQRAMVLASGKLRFVKNLSRSTHKSSSKTTKTKHRRYEINMRRNRKIGYRRPVSIERTVIKIVKGSSLLAPAAATIMGPGDASWKLHRLTHDYTGYHSLTGKWEPHQLIAGWGPFVGVTLAEKGYRLIKRLMSGF